MHELRQKLNDGTSQLLDAANGGLGKFRNYVVDTTDSERVFKLRHEHNSQKEVFEVKLNETEDGNLVWEGLPAPMIPHLACFTQENIARQPLMLLRIVLLKGYRAREDLERESFFKKEGVQYVEAIQEGTFEHKYSLDSEIYTVNGE